MRAKIKAIKPRGRKYLHSLIDLPLQKIVAYILYQYLCAKSKIRIADYGDWYYSLLTALQIS